MSGGELAIRDRTRGGSELRSIGEGGRVRHRRRGTSRLHSHFRVLLSVVPPVAAGLGRRRRRGPSVRLESRFSAGFAGPGGVVPNSKSGVKDGLEVESQLVSFGLDDGVGY